MPDIAALVFSDLDGTLLDHETYGFDAARPALHALQDRDIPLILNTSKTLVEVVDINRALHNSAPVIVENGGAMAFPLHLEYPFALPEGETVDGYRVVRFAPRYEDLLGFIAQQRSSADYRLQGFADMSPDEVSRLTGLATEEAAQARQRLCSEPFIWHDSEARLVAFADAADAAGLRVTRGGRFHHLMGDTSKAAAMHEMSGLYAGAWPVAPTTVALGDSENDIEMLQGADVAVIVMRPDGTHLACRGRRSTIKTREPGPAGWNDAIETLLNEFDTAAGRP
jgi:mannosyl-3-phosphoglycerate phosphatase